MRAIGLMILIFGLSSSLLGQAPRAEAIQLWSGFDIVKDRGRTKTYLKHYFVGLAAPVTPDGYCVTAAHVVDAEPVATIHWKGSPSQNLAVAELDAARVRYWLAGTDRVITRDTDAFQFVGVRVVHRFKKADLAIVKIGVPTPGYYPQAMPLSSDDAFTVVANPYVHHRDARILQADRARRISTGTRARPVWKGQFPVGAKQGDSGSPVLDRLGNLVGIITASFELRTWRPFSIKRERMIEFEGVSHADTLRIVDADRAVQTGQRHATASRD